MDSATFVILSTYLPPEIITIIDDYLIVAYRREARICLKDLISIEESSRHLLTIDTTQYSYNLCSRCGALVSNVRTPHLTQYTLNCEHVRNYYMTKRRFGSNFQYVSGILFEKKF